MLIKVNEIKVPIVHTDLDIQRVLSNTLRIRPSSIVRYKILKKSIDSRQKDLKYVYSLGVEVLDSEKGLKKCGKYQDFIFKEYTLDNLIKGYSTKNIDYRPVIIGSGPAGLFAGLTLAKLGLKPIIIERGEPVDKRQEDVKIFNLTQRLNINSNIQFGEGGAGTFSDGKLNTGISSDLINVVLQEFVNYGANECILYESKPHIGTDCLVNIIKNMRRSIEAYGGEVRFNTKFVDVEQNCGELTGIIVENNSIKETIKTKVAIMAIGHSARDTFSMLSTKVMMQQKPFSIGVRVEHLQDNISKSQYGENYRLLPPAPYKLSCHLDNDRSCYSFCMCPGGYVVAASSEEGGVVTNGMSYSKRDGINANSGLLVGITPKDFKSDKVLAGVDFQRKYETLAYNISNSYKAPCQRFGDLKQNKISTTFNSVKPTYPIGVVEADLRACLPNYVIDSIIKAMDIFNKKISGFADEDAIFTGVESRSSSPVKILRDKNGSSSIKGLMPCGEGAGYAGGITSAAIDGINIALLAINLL